VFATEKERLREVTCPAPGCATAGSLVPATTIAGLLTDEAKRRLGNPEGFRFCPSRDCEIVYWSPVTGARFTKGDLIVRVGLKETTAPRPVCYCFNFGAEDIEQQVCETGGCAIPDEITQKVRAGLCFCERANPQGTCCLGNVRTVVSAAQESIGVAGSGRRGHDLLAAAWAKGLWCFAVVMGVGGAFVDVARAPLWSVGFGVAGILCVVNAMRSRRLHCVFTGPIFLAGTILTVLRWSSVVETPWSLIGAGVLLGTVIPCLWECLSGKTYVGDGDSADCCGPGLSRTLRGAISTRLEPPGDAESGGRQDPSTLAR
jgi:hypothetical protein